MTEDRAGEGGENWWTQTYRSDDAVPWDTGRPQSQIVALAQSGEISGRVLDVGCGLGTETLYLAERGHAVVGVDFAPSAIERARDRVRNRPLEGNLEFKIADAFSLSEADVGVFETILDVGFFHTLERSDYADYVASLGEILHTGGRAILLEFGPEAPDDWGPNPVSERDVRHAFDEGWKVETVEGAPFETRQRVVRGIRGIIERTE